MAHNLFHANYGDYKKSSPDTAVLLLLSKVTQKHFRQPYRPSKVPLRPAGVQDVRRTSALHRPKRSGDLFYLLRYSLN